ncbi:peroxiredoxin [Actinomycetospora sp. NBRC 106375]|uniref:OsmC family protein n=1 Tax=Actinomycetospora sp. NBRC 106375 TaxID=3032207 RepID=UPI0024A3A869|nr:OsmC family protein [Actinomycetospora sp. NBRC 106375]GLZ46276.1 peroxiredoxin [Actinomycetospora sp. NBRC 106375]
MAFTRDPDGTHRYRATCTWSGSTGLGYDGFVRAHRVEAPPAATALELSNDPSLRGDASLLDPEQLVLAAAASCQLLSFLAIAARARVDVTDYRDDAEATMSHDEGPARIAAIVLRPHITVAPGPSVPRVERLVELAHKECYIANSLATPVAVEPVVTFM